MLDQNEVPTQRVGVLDTPKMPLVLVNLYGQALGNEGKKKIFSTMINMNSVFRHIKNGIILVLIY